MKKIKKEESEHIVLEQILENIPYFIFWKDKDSRYLGTNNKFAQSAGYKNSKEIVGKTDYDCCWTKEEADFFVKIDKEVMASNTPILNIEEPQKQLDGSTSTLLTSKVPLHNSQGEVIGLLGIYTDITGRKNLEIEKDKALEELKEVQEQLIHSEKMRSLGEMAGGIAHEINNPLGAIMGYCSLIKKDIRKGKLDPEKTGERLDKINETINRISRITSSLRSLSRNDNTEELTTESIKDILEGTLSLCQESLKNLEINIELNFNNVDTNNNGLLCNRITLNQTILNLLNNSRDAIQHNEGEKWIKLEIELKDQFIIRVVDSGKGIAKNIVNNIFEPFYTTKEVGEGTGIGLSLSRKLLKKQNAELVYNESFSNTCFEIRFHLTQIIKKEAL